MSCLCVFCNNAFASIDFTCMVFELALSLCIASPPGPPFHHSTATCCRSQLRTSSCDGSTKHRSQRRGRQLATNAALLAQLACERSMTVQPSLESHMHASKRLNQAVLRKHYKHAHIHTHTHACQQLTNVCQQVTNVAVVKFEKTFGARSSKILEAAEVARPHTMHVLPFLIL